MAIGAEFILAERLLALLSLDGLGMISQQKVWASLANSCDLLIHEATLKFLVKKIYEAIDLFYVDQFFLISKSQAMEIWSATLWISSRI